MLFFCRRFLSAMLSNQQLCDYFTIANFWLSNFSLKERGKKTTSRFSTSVTAQSVRETRRTDGNFNASDNDLCDHEIMRCAFFALHEAYWLRIDLHIVDCKSYIVTFFWCLFSLLLDLLSYMKWCFAVSAKWHFLLSLTNKWQICIVSENLKVLLKMMTEWSLFREAVTFLCPLCFSILHLFHMTACNLPVSSFLTKASALCLSVGVISWHGMFQVKCRLFNLFFSDFCITLESLFSFVFFT